MIFKLTLTPIKSISIEAKNENIALARLILYLMRYNVDEESVCDLWSWSYRAEPSTTLALRLRDKLIDKDIPLITVDNCKQFLNS